MRQVTGNQVYVAALLHGRRSRMAEGARLRTLSQTPTMPDFALEVLGAADVSQASEVQLRLMQELAREAVELGPHLNGEAADLLPWLASRFQIENLKLLVRRLMTGAPLAGLKAHLAPLSIGLKLDVEALSRAESMEVFAGLMPRGTVHRQLVKAIDLYHEQPRSFFFEAALDRGYFVELLRRANALPTEESGLVREMVIQEVDTFHLMLATRGKFLYDLELEELLPLHLPGTRITRSIFEAMLSETELRAVASQALGRAIDALAEGGSEGAVAAAASDPGTLERLAWTRFWRLANWVFRRSHMGLAMVVAYVELRRVEVANLITLSEGIRLGAPRETLFARLIPLTRLETVHV